MVSAVVAVAAAWWSFVESRSARDSAAAALSPTFTARAEGLADDGEVCRFLLRCDSAPRPIKSASLALPTSAGPLTCLASSPEGDGNGGRSIEIGALGIGDETEFFAVVSGDRTRPAVVSVSGKSAGGYEWRCPVSIEMPNTHPWFY